MFEAELRSIDEKDIEVMVRDGVLALKGEKESEQDKKEERYLSFSRAQLP